MTMRGYNADASVDAVTLRDGTVRRAHANLLIRWQQCVDASRRVRWQTAFERYAQAR